MSSFKQLSDRELRRINSFWLAEVNDIVEQCKICPKDKKIFNLNNLSELHELIISLSNPKFKGSEKQRRQLAAYTQVLWDGLREQQGREFTDLMKVL